jgi:hypothetical protein
VWLIKHSALPVCSLPVSMAWHLDMGTKLSFHVVLCFEYNVFEIHKKLCKSKSDNMLQIIVRLQHAMGQLI